MALTKAVEFCLFHSTEYAGLQNIHNQDSHNAIKTLQELKFHAK